MKCIRCNKQVPERVALWIQGTEQCTCDEEKPMGNDAKTVSTKSPTTILEYKHLLEAIADLREARRISEVERRALMELSRDLMKELSKQKDDRLSQTLADMITRASELTSVSSPIVAWVEALVMAAEGLGYKVPKFNLSKPQAPLLSMPETSLILRARELYQMKGTTWVEAIVRAATEQGYEPPHPQPHPHEAALLIRARELCGAKVPWVEAIVRAATERGYEPPKVYADSVTLTEITRLNSELAKGVELLQNICKENNTEMVGKDIEIARLREENQRLLSELQTANRERLYHIVIDADPQAQQPQGLISETVFDHRRECWGKWPLFEASRLLYSTTRLGYMVKLQEVQP